MIEQKRNLVEQHIKMAERIARKAGRGYHDIDDLVGYAYEMLLKLADKWQPHKDVPFGAYVSTYLPRMLHRYRNKHSFPIIGYLKCGKTTIRFVSLDSIANEADTTNVADDVCNRMQCNSLLQTLTPDERVVIQMRYIDGQADTDEQVAKILKVSQQAVAKRKNRALRKMRNAV